MGSLLIRFLWRLGHFPRVVNMCSFCWSLYQFSFVLYIIRRVVLRYLCVSVGRTITNVVRTCGPT